MDGDKNKPENQDDSVSNQSENLNQQAQESTDSTNEQSVQPDQTIQPQNPTNQPTGLDSDPVESSDTSKPAESTSAEPAQSATGELPSQDKPDVQNSTPSLGTPEVAKQPEPINKKKKMSLKVAIAITISLLALGAAGVFGWYIPNRPENVWAAGMERSGEAFEEIVLSSVEQESLDTLKSMDFSAQLDAAFEGGIITGSMSARYTDEVIDSSLAFDLSADGENASMEVDFLTEQPEDAVFPDSYFRITGIDSFGLDMFMPGISNYDGQWIEVSGDWLETSAPDDIVDAFERDDQEDELLTAEELTEITQAAITPIRDRLFTSDDERAVLKMGDFKGTESLEDNVTANRYEATVDLDNAAAFCYELADSVLSTDAVQNQEDVDSQQIEEWKSSAQESCQRDTESEIEDEIEVWIDTRTKLVHKIRVTDNDNENNYTEIGQSYQGGDSVPMFMRFYEGDSGLSAEFDIETNIKTHTTQATLQFEQADNDIYVTLDFEAKPLGSEFEIEPPSDTVPIQQLLDELNRPLPGLDEPADPMTEPTFELENTPNPQT
ncbi:MAG: hypothetical protein U5K77_03470 [Candidatus Saccharibacteria bacterium]|nr:hypothetical protein [Candidatus Saccharibacteria bacterium]